MADDKDIDVDKATNEELKAWIKNQSKKATLQTEEIKRRKQITKEIHAEREALADLKDVHDANFEAEISAASALAEEGRKARQYKLDNQKIDAAKAASMETEAAKQEKLLKASQELEKANRDQFNTILTGLTGIDNQWKKSTWGMLLEEEGWRAFGKGIKETFTPMNMLGSSLLKVQESTIALAGAQDEAIAGMNKMTSGAPGLEDKLIALEHNFQSYGVSAEEASQALGTLFTETSDFSKMSDSTQKELSETTAVLNELGVEMGTTAQITQTMTKVFGKSGEESAATSRELFSFAQSIGMNAEEVSKNFAQAAPEMAAFGDKSVDTFKKLQASAKSSGIEVSRMLSIVEKFDTFDGAAESVGQLNAILGGPFLSSLDMVTTTDPTERMKMLSEAVNESGQSFDDMSYYQRKALAEAMGLESAAELALVMRDGFDATVPAVEQSQEALAAQADQTQKFQTMQDELNQTMRAFAVSMRPVIEAFKMFLNGVQWFNKQLGPVGIGLIVATIGAFVLLAKVLKMVNFLQNLTGFNMFKNFALKIKDIFFTKAQTETTEGLADAQNKQAKATGKSGKAAGSAVPMLLALGAAVLMIGGGVFLAAAGVALLVLAFSQLNVAQMAAATVALIAFGIGVVTVISILATLVTGPQAAITGAAIGVLLAVGAAAFLIGAAVGIAAAGLALLVGSFALLFNVADPTTMLAFTAAFAGFVAVLYMMLPLASFLPLLVIVLGAIAATFIGIAFAMSKMDFSNFEPLAEFFKGLSSVVSDTEGRILQVAEAMAMMTDEINKLDADKAVKYTAVMTSTAAAASSPAFAGGGSATASSGAPNSAQPIEIVVKLKERVLGKAFGKILDGKFQVEA